LVEATPQGFANGINKVLSDSDFANQISRSAQDFAEEHFSDDAYIEMVGEVYNKMFSAIEEQSK